MRSQANSEIFLADDRLELCVALIRRSVIEFFLPVSGSTLRRAHLLARHEL
jgi:hypothetical protein